MTRSPFRREEEPLVTRFAENFIKHLSKGEYDQAVGLCTNRLTSTQIKGAWLNSLHGKGQFKGIVYSALESPNGSGGIVVRVFVNFESGRNNALVTVKKSNNRYKIFDYRFLA